MPSMCWQHIINTATTATVTVVCTTAVAALIVTSASASTPPAALHDWRFINTGTNISDGFGYADQPQVVLTSDGAWQCVITVNSEHEGQGGQRVVSTRSTDAGASWQPATLIEPQTNVSSGWVNNLLVPSSGRIFAFYTFNFHNVTTNPTTGKPLANSNLLGEWVFRVSDDGGRTWSSDRWVLPERETAIDLTNFWNGTVREGWSVGKPVIVEGSSALHEPHRDAGSSNATVYMQFAKVSTATASSEGFFWASSDVLDPSVEPGDVQWTLLPDGDHGLRPSCGSTAEEGSLVAAHGGAVLYAVYRTRCGVANSATSTDGGHTFVDAQMVSYDPADYGTALYSKAVKQPQGPTSIRAVRRSDVARGTYLMTVYDDGFIPGWDNRNPMFLIAGWDATLPDGTKTVLWSQPEVLLYQLPPCEQVHCGTGYPDFVQPSDEAGADIYLTETDKVTARLHLLNRTLLDGLFAQRTARAAATVGLVVNASVPSVEAEHVLAKAAHAPASAWSFKAPAGGWGNLSAGDGFSLELSLTGAAPRSTAAAGASVAGATPTTLVDCRDASSRGVALTLNASGQVTLILSDGTHNQTWSTDPECPIGTVHSTAAAGGAAHVTVIVDGLARYIGFVVNGVLNDGGATRAQGWGHLSPDVTSLGGGGRQGVCTADPIVTRVRGYDRYLRTSEAIANWRSTAVDVRLR